MEVPQTIKQEKDDYFTQGDVKFQTNVIDSMEIKTEPLKVEPDSYVLKANNLNQTVTSTEEEAIISANNDKNMFNFSLNKISDQKDSEIKLEEIEKMKDIVTVKCEEQWTIEHEELNNKNETNIEDAEQGNPSELVQQQLRQQLGSHEKPDDQHTSLKGHKFKHTGLKGMCICYHCDYQTAYKSQLKLHLVKHKNPDEVHKYKCDQCDYQTVYKRNLKMHVLTHKNPDEVIWYKCDQCDFQTIHKHYLKTHSLKHKNPDEVDRYKCDQCEFQAVHKHYLKRHLIIHKSRAEIDMYKCDVCDFQTIYKHRIKLHLVIHKNPSERTYYKCDQCDYQAKHKENLKRHLLLHKKSGQS